MSVNRDEVRRIASLAKLRLDDEEADRLTDEMNRILEHAERLRSMGASNGDDPTTSRNGEAGEVAAGGEGHGSVGPEEPDPLVRAPETFAPRMVDGFFVVPPPPGVQREPDVP